MAASRSRPRALAKATTRRGRGNAEVKRRRDVAAFEAWQRHKPVAGTSALRAS